MSKHQATETTAGQLRPNSRLSGRHRTVGASWRRIAAVAAAGTMLAAVAALSGAGAAAAKPTPASLAFTPSPFNYGQVTTGQTASQTFTLANTGGKATGALTVTVSDSAAFTTTSDACTGTSLGVGKSCAVTVQFAPTSAATATATLTAASTKSAATDALTGAGVAPSHIYWANAGAHTINKANPDGSNPQFIADGGNTPVGVAVGSSHLYWASEIDGTIWEANLDGTSPQAIVTGQIGPWGVAVDSSHLYWANSGTSGADGTINEANLDGTGPQAIITGQFSPLGVAVGP